MELKTAPISEYDPEKHGPMVGVEVDDYPIDDAIKLISDFEKTVGTEAAVLALKRLKETGRNTVFIGFHNVEGRAKILIV